MKKKNPIVELLLCIFLGYFGVHKFYVGKKGMGILYLLTVGLCGLGWLVDIVMLILNLLKNKKPATIQSGLRTEDFHVAGTSYHLDSISRLGKENRDWSLNAQQLIAQGKGGKRIYRYYYTNSPVELKPEPTNAYDSNAIMVLVADTFVGYIQQSDNLHVKDILENYNVKFISCFIGGGEYKEFISDDYLEKYTDGIKINVRIGYSAK